ncbi:MAG: hypothetical protein AAFN30_04050, partial [Actinomycetota bacterium]
GSVGPPHHHRGPLPPPEGDRVEVVAVDLVEPADITDDDAVRAGHGNAAELREHFAALEPDRSLYRVEFRLLAEPDPREELAGITTLGPEDRAEIDRRLDRLDRAAADGPWTRSTLELIAAHPGTRAPDLAQSQGRETKPFKLDVRKLKNLGLTRSLRIGYELSPRGAAYLDGRRS